MRRKDIAKIIMSEVMEVRPNSSLQFYLRNGKNKDMMYNRFYQPKWYDEYPGKNKEVWQNLLIEKARLIREKRRLKALKNNSEMFPVDDIVSKEIKRITPLSFSTPKKIPATKMMKESMSTKSPYNKPKRKEEMTGNLVRNTSMNFNKK